MSGRPANWANIDKSYSNQLTGLGGQLGSLNNDLKYAFTTVVGNTGDRINSLLKTLTTLKVVAEPPLQRLLANSQPDHATAVQTFSKVQPIDPREAEDL
ncbi:hypothetical protein PtA15_10A181 [Puccinia triticina]|uniref:Uncharacterized protein n=1 Tax=Puccinia triticina TaxID=208348 RepID=A0ABY7CWC3_9BASI|nr:uncharacterized protein PtA15_10A181 [Puccinia triticina]WAQ88762.1 hypothetical protein PtA15_10A181 [Puccinia triticina]